MIINITFFILGAFTSAIVALIYYKEVLETNIDERINEIDTIKNEIETEMNSFQQDVESTHKEMQSDIKEELQRDEFKITVKENETITSQLKDYITTKIREKHISSKDKARIKEIHLKNVDNDGVDVDTDWVVYYEEIPRSNELRNKR